MKSTTLGFASVLLCGISVAPLLVRTDQIAPQASETSTLATSERVEVLPATGRIERAGHGRHPAALSSSRLHGRRSALSSQGKA